MRTKTKTNKSLAPRATGLCSQSVRHFVIINIVDGGISFPNLGGGGIGGDWSWSNEGIDGTSPDR